MILHCATSNPGKQREFRMVAGPDWEIEPLPGLATMVPPEETGQSFEENAILKAVYYGSQSRGWLFAEDSGLEVDALGRAPGVYSARYAGPTATDADNNRKLLADMQGLDNRTARFVCTIALTRAGELVRTFRASVEGRIADQARGVNGFGYDPVFYYPPFGCTFGEVEPQRKQSVSHRGQALAAMMDYLRSAR